jgi:hypothetical protein
MAEAAHHQHHREMLRRSASPSAHSTTSWLGGSQLDFVNLVIDHLTQCGRMRPEQLHSSSFTDEFSGGPNSVFIEHQAVQALISTLSVIERNATGTPISE